jgi:hypothetical protein
MRLMYKCLNRSMVTLTSKYCILTSSDKSMRGWTFFAILASSFSPSKKLYLSIVNYLAQEIKNNPDRNITQRANYVLIRLYRIHEQRRKQIPSDNEITHVEAMKPIMFPINFFSGTHTHIPTESYTTVNELKTTLMRKLELNISRIPYYSLYEICTQHDKVEERFLDPTEKIVDIIAVWGREKEDHVSTQMEFNIYLKLQLYYPFTEDDVDSITMIYVQTCYDVVSGKYNLATDTYIQLAALQLLINLEKKSHEEIYKLLDKSLEAYLPRNAIRMLTNREWIDKIMDTYSGLKISSKTEAKLTYIEQMKQNCLWEAHQFYCKVINT